MINDTCGFFDQIGDVTIPINNAYKLTELPRVYTILDSRERHKRMRRLKIDILRFSPEEMVRINTTLSCQIHKIPLKVLFKKHIALAKMPSIRP